MYAHITYVCTYVHIHIHMSEISAQTKSQNRPKKILQKFYKDYKIITY